MVSLFFLIIIITFHDQKFCDKYLSLSVEWVWQQRGSLQHQSMEVNSIFCFIFVYFFPKYSQWTPVHRMGKKIMRTPFTAFGINPVTWELGAQDHAARHCVSTKEPGQQQQNSGDKPGKSVPVTQFQQLLITILFRNTSPECVLFTGCSILIQTFVLF